MRTCYQDTPYKIPRLFYNFFLEVILFGINYSSEWETSALEFGASASVDVVEMSERKVLASRDAYRARFQID